MNMLANSFISFLYTLVVSFIRYDCIGTAAQTAFYLTLSIPPMLALALSVSQRLTVSGTIFNVLEFIFPANVSDILGSLLIAIPKSTSATVISAAGVIFAASGSTWALMRGIHKAYTREKMKYSLKNRIIALLFTVVLILLIAASLGSVVIGSFLSSFYEMFSGESFLFSAAKRSIAVFGVYAFLHTLYRFTPDVGLKSGSLFWGAAFSACSWVLVSTLFGTYVKFFTKYTTVYGGIGAFFILIVWLFVISLIILLGAHINGALLETKNSKR